VNVEHGQAGDSATSESQDVRSRCLADGYLPEDLEGLTEEDMVSLLDYVEGSTMEGCATRLPKMMIWTPDNPSEEIAKHHALDAARERHQRP
jgi:hypothetical protein